MSCQQPAWLGDNKNQTCPFGISGPGDITIPNDLSFGSMVCVVYSYVVYVVGGGSILEALLLRSTRAIVWSVMMASMVACNELCFKALLAWPRPGYDLRISAVHDGDLQGSCNISCGAPSSHALIAYVTLLVYLLDATRRLGLPADDRVRPSCRIYFTCVPFTATQHLLWADFCKGFLKWTALLGPVPLCRIVLHDHSSLQILLSCIIVAIGGTIIWLLAMTLARRFESKENSYLCSGLCYHDLYALPPLIAAHLDQANGNGNEQRNMQTLGDDASTCISNDTMRTSFLAEDDS